MSTNPLNIPPCGSMAMMVYPQWEILEFAGRVAGRGWKPVERHELKEKGDARHMDIPDAEGIDGGGIAEREMPDVSAIKDSLAVEAGFLEAGERYRAEAEIALDVPLGWSRTRRLNGTYQQQKMNYASWSWL